MPDRDKVLRAGDAIVVLPGKSGDEIFLMVLCVITALPVVFGRVAPPGSIEALLEPWLVQAWSFVLLIGALVVLTAFMFKDRVTGMIVEQFGSVCLGVAATLYAIAIFVASYRQGGAIPAAIIFGFALARFYQAYDYQKTLKKVQVVKSILERGEAHGN